MADMKIVSMERTEAEKKAAEERYKEGPTLAGPDYPYGLCLSLEKDELAKLGVEKLPEVGDEFHVYAVTKVTRVSQSASEGGEDSKGIELQITDMGVLHEDEGDAFSKAANKLYGKAEAAEGEG